MSTIEEVGGKGPTTDNVRSLKRGAWLANGEDVFSFEDTMAFGSGGPEARISALVRRFDSPPRWVATIALDGQRVHESEHQTAADATQAIGAAASQAQKLRWKP